MEMKPISVEISDVELDLIENQNWMMQQIYSAFKIPNSMWGLYIPIAKKKPITLKRNQTLKYLRWQRRKKRNGLK